MADNPTSDMTGADALVQTLADHGVTACFANPGTSEMHLVTAFDREPRIRSVLCLFEGVATGAADGFARIARQPAMTLLHLGPGYENGGANTHNARRAFSPLINVIGDHAVSHRRHDAPLASNIVGLAAPNAHWVKSIETVADAGRLASEAWMASFGPAPGPVSLILPADSAWSTGGAVAPAASRPEQRRADPNAVAKIAEDIKNAQKPALLVNGTALMEPGLSALGRLQAAGIMVLTDTFVPRQTRGAGHFAPDRLQYFAEIALAQLEGVDLLVLAGTKSPVAFFAYPDKPGSLVPEGCETRALGGADYDSAALVDALADALEAPASGPVPQASIPDKPTGELTPGTIGDSLARHMPQQAIVADDGVTGSLAAFLPTATARAHDWLMLTGGAIGMGMPLALGAAIAAPDRKVICLSGDGAGMYTNQALWSFAREQADIVTIVFVNHSYRILNIELYRTGAGNPGPASQNMLNLGHPEIDWAKLAEAQGVEAEAVATAAAFDAALERAVSASGPRLIAAHIAG